MIKAKSNEGSENSVTSLDTIREEILNKLILAASIFTLFPLGASLLRIPNIGWQPAMYFQIVTYAVIVSTAIFRQRLSYVAKALIVILFCFLVGCVTTYNMGLIGSGVLFMVFALILSTMFFGVPQSIGLSIIGLVFLVAVAFGFNNGWIGYDFAVESLLLSYSSWFSKIFAFTLFSLILVYSLGQLISYLVASGNMLKERTTQLRRTNQKLLQEIAEKKTTQDELVRSENSYRLLAENASDVIWTTDLNLHLTYVSPSVERVRGYTVEEALAQRPEERISSESLTIVTQALSEELRQEENENKDPFRSRTLELESICKDGSTRWSETKITFIRDPDGKAIGLLGVNRDITEQKIAAEEKKRLEDRLIQSQKMEAIGTLAGGIAHDFNNILSAIIGYTDLLKMNLPDSSKELNYTNQIQLAGDRAKNLVHQILTFSRQSEPELKPVEINTVVQEVSKLLRSTLPTTIEIRENIQDSGLVMGDATQLHQILMNLGTNAGHAMLGKGGLLTIELKNLVLTDDTAVDQHDLSPGNYIQLKVSDTGHGIPANHLERIFEPFFTTKERDKGTGMGLSVVHGIVESYKGTIHVYSQAGKGSTFTILLPAIKRRAETEKHEVEVIPKGTEHILFVDDEPLLIEMATSQLESLGYTVSSRSNSLEALELFRNKPNSFDIVITDMTMPKMAGDALASEIKGINPDIPIILCTGFSLKISQGNVQQFDIDACLLKPIIMGEMAKTIRDLLDRKVGATPVPEKQRNL